MAWVYIMANRRFGTLYVGATSNLLRRVWQHKNDVLPGFTRKNQCHLLVWFEEPRTRTGRYSASTPSSIGSGTGKSR
ncbi:GIY-YIG nuclease family protein [Devosia lucknowensis]|uniref:GIY-YIG nuclease family protein n=1 Tax=Devosia lucknowensis TaxID=1096929 RepID=UPI00313E7D0E